MMCIHLVRQKVMLMYVQHKYYVQKTCGCTKANGKPCSTLFSVHYIDRWAQASLLTREVHLVFLGSIMTTVLDRDSIVNDRHKPAKQKSIIKSWLQSVQNHLCNIVQCRRKAQAGKYYEALPGAWEKTRVYKNTR